MLIIRVTQAWINMKEERIDLVFLMCHNFARTRSGVAFHLEETFLEKISPRDSHQCFKAHLFEFTSHQYFNHCIIIDNPFFSTLTKPKLSQAFLLSSWPSPSQM